ncbi:MAG: restriction endonuclease [Candidatus Dormibacteria bacterium]
MAEDLTGAIIPDWWGRSKSQSEARSRREAAASEMLSQIDSLTGSRAGASFEEWVAQLLDSQGFDRVTRVGGPGDHGADLVLEGAGARTVVQVKWSAKDAIGAQGVQQVHMARSYYGASSALLVSNQEFTRQAKDEAGSVAVVLWGRGRVRELLARRVPVPPRLICGELFAVPGAALGGGPAAPPAEGPAYRGWTVGHRRTQSTGYFRRSWRGVLWRAGVIVAATAAAEFGLHVWLAELAGLLLGGCLVTLGRGSHRAAGAWRAAGLGIGLAANPLVMDRPMAVLGALAVAAAEALIAARATARTTVAAEDQPESGWSAAPTAEAA